MRVNIKLQFGLEIFEPLHRNNFILELTEGTSIIRLVEIIGIPVENAKIILINGIPIKSLQDEIQDNDRIIIFPFIGGG